MPSSPVYHRRGNRTLADIIADVPATNPDTIADSCSDDSDVDEPKALPHPQQPLGSVKINSMPTPRRVVSPSESKVQKSVGKGGKIVYQVASPGGPESYYMVQW